MSIPAKKILIILIYLILFSPLLFAFFGLFFPKETCFDAIKNQNEQDVDCGGICQKNCDKIEAEELKISELGTVPSGLIGKYDFFAKVLNPNVIFGSKKFDYEVAFIGAEGQSLGSRKGSGFILPGEKKYVVETNIELAEIPQSYNFKIINSEWVGFNEYYEKPDIQIVNKNYTQISDGIGFSEAKGLLKNKSPYDFEIIKIQIILKDEKDMILAINSTQMKTVKSGEERDFRVFWPNSFPGTVQNMEVQAEVNVFDSAAFFQRYYKTEKFQQYE